MNIELKNIKYAEFASHETSCYEAAVYVDGKKVGHVANEGFGGCDMQDIPRATLDEINAWCKANLPKWESYDGTMVETDFEMHCHHLLEEHLIRRDYLRAAKAKVLFVKKGETAIYQISKRQRGHTFTDEQVIAEMRKKYPDATYLNELAEADALALWKAAAS